VCSITVLESGCSQFLSSEIAKDTGFAAELELLDLAKFASVNAFIDRLKDSPVDILVPNAGVAAVEHHATEDGWEET
jgi:retinol dehydrogenase 12